MHKRKIRTYLYSIGIALGVGGLSALLSSSAMKSYEQTVNQPPLSPPPFIFPIVWTVLFILMGIGAARVWLYGEGRGRKRGLILYVLQLIFNFAWTLIFFNLQAFGFSFVWLLALITLVGMMMLYFYFSDRTASLLQIPYLLWLCFAAVLNFMVWKLN